MRFIFVSDLHSNKMFFYELEALISSIRADAIIIGGDIFDYSPHAEPQIEFAKGFLCEFFKNINIKKYIVNGNCDKPQSITYLNNMKKEMGIELLGLTGTRINNNINLFGYGHIPPSPFKIKDYERRDMEKDKISFETPCLLSNSYDELNLIEGNFLNYLPSIEKELNCLNARKSIWVMHSPPYGGILDKTHSGVSAGSKAIRKQIEQVQPLISLHGHIHEAPLVSSQWAERIGDTVSVNPGVGKCLHAVIFDMDTYGDIKSIRHNKYGELTI